MKKLSDFQIDWFNRGGKIINEKLRCDLKKLVESDFAKFALKLLKVSFG